MQIESQASSLQGEVLIPSSKSHTVRALFFALLAEGESTIRHPLDSGDTRAALLAAQGLGAEIAVGEAWTVQGRGGPPAPPANVLDVANSGTTLYIAAGAAALMDGCAVFTGDGQIRRRSAENLLAALRDLGAEAFSTRGNGCAPLVVGGPLRGGSTRIECPTSQYLTSLLMAAPLAPEETRIEVPLLHEAPYVRMTLDWLERLGVRVTAAADLSEFTVPGGQGYRSFDRQMPGDYSSATFFLCAAAVTEGEVLLRGLDPADPQGDKAVLDYLRAMGATVAEEADGLRVGGGALRGTELDLNATPDALPAMAVTACFAEGTTRLVNVPQARMKETDRIAVMAAELERLGGRVRELADGLEIEGAGLRGGKVCGHGDHRVVMSLCLAGLRCREPVRVTTAESVAVTFPDFPEKLAALGGRVRLIED